MIDWLKYDDLERPYKSQNNIEISQTQISAHARTRPHAHRSTANDIPNREVPSNDAATERLISSPGELTCNSPSTTYYRTEAANVGLDGRVVGHRGFYLITLPDL